MQFAVTGETYNGIDILTNDGRHDGPQQITLMEALTAHTRGPAWFSREENERGQLKAGYLADVVILDRNPFAVDVHTIRDTKAALTIVDGEVVYTNGSLKAGDGDRGDRRDHDDRRGR
jgi:predicted amidohydrolase YtcJ